MWSVRESVLYSSVVCVHRSGQQTKGSDLNSALSGVGAKD